MQKVKIELSRFGFHDDLFVYCLCLITCLVQQATGSTLDNNFCFSSFLILIHEENLLRICNYRNVPVTVDRICLYMRCQIVWQSLQKRVEKCTHPRKVSVLFPRFCPSGFGPMYVVRTCDNWNSSLCLAVV